MRVLVLFGLATAATAGYLGEVLSSFPAPAANPNALATDGAGSLFIFCSTSPFLIWRVEATTGSVYSSFPSPFGGPTRGLGYEHGGYLWIGRWLSMYLAGLVARCSASTGSIYSSFEIARELHDLYGGLDCQGIPSAPNTLTAVISDGFVPAARATRHTPAGSLLSSFPIPASFRDPAWDYGNGLIWFPHQGDGYIYAYTTAGSFVTWFSSPAGQPCGAAYADETLWVSCAATGLVYRLACPHNITVAPVSYGKIKALYR